MRNKSIQIKVLLYTFLLFPLLGENIISCVFGNYFSKLVSIASCLSIFFLVLKQRKLKINTFFFILIIMILHRLFIIFCLPSNTLNNVNNIIAPYGLIGYFMYFVLVELCMNNKNTLLIVFKSSMNVMTVCVILNFVLTSDLHIANNFNVFKEAITTGYTNSRGWLLGHRNMIFIHHLMWIAFSYIVYKLDNNKIYNKIFYFQVIFTLIVGLVSWNSTMILTTLLMLLLFVLRHVIYNVSIIHYVMIYFVLEIGIVFYRIQNVFSFLIVDLLHRNLSFTGRTAIWDYYIGQFNSGKLINILFGNLGFSNLSINSHNMFLGLLVFTGIIGLLMYLMVLIISAKKMYKQKNNEMTQFITIILFSFLINSLTMEFYLQPLIAFYLGYNVEKLIKMTKTN